MLIKEHEMNGLCLNYVTKSSKSSKKKKFSMLIKQHYTQTPKKQSKSKTW